jgi:WD40 repeat protein
MPKTRTGKPHQYKAFISYSHAADGRLAPALQSALQQFAKPWYQTRAIRVFRDETGLGLTPALWPSIEKALTGSDYFILLASPPAAQSKWVDQEVAWWLKHRSWDRLLIGWTEGNLIRPTDANESEWQKTSALPGELADLFKADPLYSDLRFAKTAADLSLRNPKFLTEVARFSSTLRGRPLDELIGEDVRQHRKLKRLTRAVILALTLLTAWAIGAASIAVHERNIANEQHEQSRQRLVQTLVGNGERMVETGDLSASLLWFVEALKQEPGKSRGEQLQRTRLAAVLRQCSTLSQVWFDRLGHLEDRPTLAFSSDGRYAGLASPKTAVIWDAQSGAEVTSVAPPENASILDVCFDTPHQQFIAKGPDDTARVCEMLSGKEVLVLRHEGSVTGAAFSLDHRCIVTTSEDKTARVWDAQTGKEQCVLPHENAVDVAEFSKDGRHLLTLSGEKTIIVWDTTKRAAVKLKNTQRSWAELSSDGEHVVTTTSDTAAAALWNSTDGERLSGLGDWAWVDRAKFSSNGKRILMVSRNGWAKVWDVAQDREVVSVQHNGQVIDADLSPDGKWLVTASNDETARVWEVGSGKPMSPPLAHGETVSSVAFAPDGKRIVTRTARGVLRIWSFETSGPVILKHDEAVRQALFSKNGRYLLTATDFKAQIWNLETRGAILLEMVDSQIYHAAFSPDGLLIVTGSEDGVARLWEAASGRLVKSFQHGKRVEHAAFDSSGKRVVTASGFEVRVWDVQSGKPLASMSHSAPVKYVEFSPDGRRILAVDADEIARVWEVDLVKEVSSLQHKDVNLAVFSPAGKRLATASTVDRRVRVWDAATRAAIAETDSQDQRLVSLTFSPDGTSLAGSDEVSGTARIWSAATGLPITPPLAHGNRVMNVHFSADGRMLVTASADRTARVWDAATGRPLTPPLPHGEVVRDAEFSPVGRQLATASEDGCARVWELSPEERTVQELADLSRLVAARRLDETGAVVPMKSVDLRHLWQTRRRPQVR